MTARALGGAPLTPGVNVDAADYDAGMSMARQHGFVATAEDRMLVQYALQRHARGEEAAAERMWLEHFGPSGFGGWRLVLAAAVAADPRNHLPSR